MTSSTTPAPTGAKAAAKAPAAKGRGAAAVVPPETDPAILEARARMKASMGAVRTGKGTVRMAPTRPAAGGAGTATAAGVNVGGVPGSSAEKAKAAMKRFHMNSFPIDEVVLHRTDGTSLQFSTPKVAISPQNNITMVTGATVSRDAPDVSDLLSKWQNQVKAETAKGNSSVPSDFASALAGVAAAAAAAGGAPETDEDEDVPQLVNDFEAVATEEEIDKPE